MKEEDRKQRFVKLLHALLEESDGVKGKLAEKLNIKPSTLTRWLQGKIDPANIDLTVFANLAKVASLSNNELVRILGINENSKDLVLDRFRKLIQELLSNQSQKQLAEKLEVSSGAISGWISSETNIDPRRMDIGTLTALANEKGWTIDELLLYLGLGKDNETGQDWLSYFQTRATQLPLLTQVKLMNWFLKELENRIINWEQEKFEIEQGRAKKEFSKRQICIVLDKEDLSILSEYFNNLVTYTQLQLKNISVVIISNLPKLTEFNTLIFNISELNSTAIDLIREIKYDGDIVAFVPADLPQELLSNLKNQVTDVIMKPIDWQKLKNKPYFE